MNSVKMRDVLFIIVLFIIMYIIWRIIVVGITLVFRLFIPVTIVLGVFLGYKWMKTSGRI